MSIFFVCGLLIWCSVLVNVFYCSSLLCVCVVLMSLVWFLLNRWVLSVLFFLFVCRCLVMLVIICWICLVSRLCCCFLWSFCLIEWFIWLKFDMVWLSWWRLVLWNSLFVVMLMVNFVSVVVFLFWNCLV